MTVRRGFIDAVGNTPLLHLQGLSRETGCEIYGKAEFMNPGGSVKDQDSIDACNKFGMAMVMTGFRHFRH